MLALKNDIIAQLEKNILPLQGFKKLCTDNHIDIGFKPIENAFPNSIFPIGCIHEFINADSPNAASTNGFIAALLSRFLHMGGACLWISNSRTVFAASLKFFGINPEQIIFIDVKKEQDILYATEEALKCNKLISVISEIKNIGFKESRRLQLAAEQSRVTGFLIHTSKVINTIACVSRWNVTSLPGKLNDGMPGVGFSRWNVELLKVRNGTPATWQIDWVNNSFVEVKKHVETIPYQLRKIV